MALVLDGSGSITGISVGGLPDGIITASELAVGAVASDTVTKSIPITSTKTCTAGKALSINTSGEVGSYPNVNVIGTSRVGAAYTMQSRDGSRAITVVETSSSAASSTWTITGYAISGSTNAVSGTTQTMSITNSAGNSNNDSSMYTFWSGTQDFVLIGRKYSRDTGSGNHYLKIEALQVSVDSSGNVTKGTQYSVYSNAANGGGDAGSQFAAGYVKDNVYAVASNEGNSTTRTIFRTITQSGGSFTGATDTEAGSIVDYLNQQSVSYTSNNIIVCPSVTSVLTAAYTTNNIGTVTTTTGVITDNADSNIYWGRLNDIYLIAAYKNTSGAAILRSFSINQTTGALTSLNTYTLHSTGTYLYFQFAYKDANNLVITYKDNIGGLFYINSVSLSSGSIVGTNLVSSIISGASTIPVRYTTTTNVFMAFNSSVNWTYTVTAYLNTDTFQFAGFVNTTTSTSPASVVVNGVASGFTGLTIGSTYYIAPAYDGTITTDSSTGVKAGIALSSSTLHIRY